MTKESPKYEIDRPTGRLLAQFGSAQVVFAFPTGQKNQQGREQFATVRIAEFVEHLEDIIDGEGRATETAVRMRDACNDIAELLNEATQEIWDGLPAEVREKALVENAENNADNPEAQALAEDEKELNREAKREKAKNKKRKPKPKSVKKRRKAVKKKRGRK